MCKNDAGLGGEVICFLNEVSVTCEALDTSPDWNLGDMHQVLH